MRLFDDSDITLGTSPARDSNRIRIDLGGVSPADLFDAWQFAAADAALALAEWRAARCAQKPDAHAAYVAALDREAHAALVLEQAVQETR
jgi:hypothetical protein